LNLKADRTSFPASYLLRFLRDTHTREIYILEIFRSAATLGHQRGILKPGDDAAGLDLFSGALLPSRYREVEKLIFTNARESCTPFKSGHKEIGRRRKR